MTKYLDLNNRSIIDAFELGDDYIIIRYKSSPSLYYFTYESCGIKHVENMKRLAIEGRNLGKYIKEYTTNDYDVTLSVIKKRYKRHFFEKIH